MKTGTLIRTNKSFDIEEEMKLVNSYSRRELSPDEVYLFSVVLCDNDIDRDYERFTVETLFELSKLFVGKTGIVDHDASAKNQKARIISCAVEAVQGEKTSFRDELFRLTARAYIPRTEDNRALIEAIDAGIIKEVSVGCGVKSAVCSICSSDLRTCSHTKGKYYGGKLCFGELTEAYDAYEFSFVAVPAQRGAGVTKAYTGKGKNMQEILKKLTSEDELTLSKSDIFELKEYIDKLKNDSSDAADYRESLRKEFSALMTQTGVRLDSDIYKGIVEKLSVRELKEVIGALSKARPLIPKPALSFKGAEAGAGKNTQFTI